LSIIVNNNQGVPSYSTVIFHDQKLRKSISYRQRIRDSCGLPVTVHECQWEKLTTYWKSLPAVSDSTITTSLILL